MNAKKELDDDEMDRRLVCVLTLAVAGCGGPQQSAPPSEPAATACAAGFYSGTNTATRRRNRKARATSRNAGGTLDRKAGRRDAGGHVEAVCRETRPRHLRAFHDEPRQFHREVLRQGRAEDRRQLRRAGRRQEGRGPIRDRAARFAGRTTATSCFIASFRTS